MSAENLVTYRCHGPHTVTVASDRHQTFFFVSCLTASRTRVNSYCCKVYTYRIDEIRDFIFLMFRARQTGPWLIGTPRCRSGLVDGVRMAQVLHLSLIHI